MLLTETTPHQAYEVVYDGTDQAGRDSAPIDVLIIGAGLAGSIAALVLARRGLRVTVVDPNPFPRDNFRCDKLSPSQLALLHDLGVSDCLARLGTRLEKLQVVRNGISMVHDLTELACHYGSLVQAFRDQWSTNVTFVPDTGADIQDTSRGPRVILQSGRALTARLVILTTGHDERLQRNIGVRRRVIRTNQSLILGFQMEAAARPKACESLVHYGQTAGDGIAYVNIFALADRTQVDLFTHKRPGDPWIQAFRQSPLPMLHEAIPGLKRYVGTGAVLTPVRMAATHLWDTEAPSVPGVLLLGDAHLASCPVLGLGVTRILTGIRQLVFQHLPDWETKSHLTVEDVAGFYRDPVISDLADNSLQASLIVHALSTNTNPYWRLRRLWPTVKDLGREARTRVRLAA